jgi:hypothetical protein
LKRKGPGENPVLFFLPLATVNGDFVINDRDIGRGEPAFGESSSAW